VGRRQTWGNLDWGLEANYMRQDKEYHKMDLYWDSDRFDPNIIRLAGQVLMTISGNVRGIINCRQTGKSTPQ
jgi:hypothetical protein